MCAHSPVSAPIAAPIASSSTSRLRSCGSGSRNRRGLRDGSGGFWMADPARTALQRANGRRSRSGMNLAPARRCGPAALTRRAGVLSSTREPGAGVPRSAPIERHPGQNRPMTWRMRVFINYTSLYDFLTAPLVTADRRESTAGAGTDPPTDTDRSPNPALRAQIRPDRCASSPVPFCIHGLNARLYSEGEYNQ